MKTVIKVSLGNVDQRWYKYKEDDEGKNLEKISEGIIIEKDNPKIEEQKNNSIIFISGKNGGGTFSFKSLGKVNNYNGYAIVSVCEAEHLQDIYAVDYIGSKLNLKGNMSKGDIIDILSEGWLKRTDKDIDDIYKAYKTVIPCIVDKLLNLGSNKKHSICITGGDSDAMQDVLVCAVKCLPVCLANELSYSSDADVNAGFDIFCTSDSVDSQDVDCFDINLQEKYNGYQFNNFYAKYLQSVSALSDFLSIFDIKESKKPVEDINSKIANYFINQIANNSLAEINLKLSDIDYLYKHREELVDNNNDIAKKFTDVAYAAFFSKAYYDVDDEVKKILKNFLAPNNFIKEYCVPDVSKAIAEILVDKGFYLQYIEFLFSCVYNDTNDSTEVYPAVKKEIESYIIDHILSDIIMKNSSDKDVKAIIKKYSRLADHNQEIAKKFSDIAYKVFFSKSYYDVDDGVKEILKDYLAPKALIKDDYNVRNVIPNVSQAITVILEDKRLNPQYIEFLFSCVYNDAKNSTEVCPAVKNEIKNYINWLIITESIVKKLSDDNLSDIIHRFQNNVLKNDPDKMLDFIIKNLNSFNDRVKKVFGTILLEQSDEWISLFLSYYLEKELKNNTKLKDFLYQIFLKMPEDRLFKFSQNKNKEEIINWLKSNEDINDRISKMEAEKKSEMEVKEKSTFIGDIIDNVPVKKNKDAEKNNKKWLVLCNNCVNSSILRYKVITYKLITLIFLLALSLVINHLALCVVIYKVLDADISINLVWIIDAFYVLLYIIWARWGANIWGSLNKIKARFIIKLIFMALVLIFILVLFTYVVLRFVG